MTSQKPSDSAQILQYLRRPVPAPVAGARQFEPLPMRIVLNDIEEFLAKSRASTPQEAMAKAKYLLQIFADAAPGPAIHRRALVAAVLRELDDFILAPDSPSPGA